MPNTAPTLGFDTSAITMLEDPVAFIDPIATVGDNEGNWDGGLLQIDVANADVGDRIYVQSSGDIPELSIGITWSGFNLFYLGVQVGTLNTANGGVTGSSSLIVTFNAAATSLAVEETLRAVRFAPADDPSANVRTINVSVLDGAWLEATASRDITVTPLNDAPIITGSGATLSFTEGDGPVALFSGVTASTVEAGQAFKSVVFRIDNAVDGAQEQLVLDGTAIGLVDGTSGTTTGNGYDYTVTVDGLSALVIFSEPVDKISAGAMEELINGAAYRHVGTNPTEVTRFFSIPFLYDDGGTDNDALDFTGASFNTSVEVIEVHPMPVARNDAFAFREDHLAGDPPFNVFYGGLFEDNGNGPDSDPGNSPLSVVSADGGQGAIDFGELLAVILPSGVEIDIVKNTGNFAVIIADRYDWLPAGRTYTEHFTYTVINGLGDTATATASFTITGIDSNDSFLGTDAGETFTAGVGNDTIDARGGNDTIDGGTGVDTMLGGNGNDLFIVDNLSDRALEAAGAAAGIDTVASSAISLDLARYANVENLELRGGAALTARGNALANTLNGATNAAANVLTGLAGNDTYIVGAGDRIVEAAGVTEGYDTIISDRVSINLGAAGYINAENIVLRGSLALAATGNALANVLNGATNTAANILTGLAGNDVYYVGLGDRVVEAAGAAGGVDVVYGENVSVNLSAASFANVESAFLRGAGNVSIVGSAQGNTIGGNSGNNYVNGLGGRDVMVGGLGADTFAFSAPAHTGKTAATRDVITDFLAGTDKINLAAIDANGTAAGEGIFALIAAEGAAFSGRAGQLRWDKTGSITLVEGDTNGDRAADFQIELRGLVNLKSTDFVL